jgi:hypothetical protein
MGLTYNGTKYVFLCNSYPLKYRSLEDNVYFTLRDIFMNAASADDAIECNQFNIQLTNEIGYEDRTDTFTYTDILHDKDFVEGLVKWLNYTRPNRDLFFTDTIDEDDECTFDGTQLTTKWKYSESDKMNEYLPLDAWMESFNELKNILLPERILQIKNNISAIE